MLQRVWHRLVEASVPITCSMISINLHEEKAQYDLFDRSPFSQYFRNFEYNCIRVQQTNNFNYVIFFVLYYLSKLSLCSFLYFIPWNVRFSYVINAYLHVLTYLLRSTTFAHSTSACIRPLRNTSSACHLQLVQVAATCALLLVAIYSSGNKHQILLVSSQLRFGPLSCWWFSTFSRPILRASNIWSDLRSAWTTGPKFNKFGEGIAQSSTLNKFVLDFSYLSVSNWERLIGECVLNEGQISHFLPPPCKNSGRGGRDI